MNLVINGVEVRQNDDGLFSLTDLWKSSGNKSKRPADFKRTDSFKDLTKTLTVGNPTFKIMSNKSGRYGGGTWFCKELVYAYAMYVDPSFMIKVITAFDNLVNGRIIEAIELARDSVKIKQVKTELDKLVDNELENNIESTHKLANIINLYEKHSSSAGSALASCRGVKGKIAEVETKLTNRNQYGMNL